MKIVCAPDSFKESLSAAEAAAALARGVRRVLPEAEVVEIPLSDGGEGFLDALAAALDARLLEVDAPDALQLPELGEPGLTPPGLSPPGIGPGAGQPGHAGRRRRQRRGAPRAPRPVRLHGRRPRADRRSAGGTSRRSGPAWC